MIGDPAAWPGPAPGADTSERLSLLVRAGCAQELGLPEQADVPLFGFIGRLDYQKGVDLIRENFHWLMDEGAQLVLLGSGRQDLESSLKCARPTLGRVLSCTTVSQGRPGSMVYLRPWLRLLWAAGSVP